MKDNTILQLRNITKTYPGVTALDNVSLDIKKGEVHALVGENGAGKSTLIKTCTGAISPNEGEIIVEGKEFTEMTPKSSEENGISVIYQEFNLVGGLSVAENIFLGNAIRNGIVIDRKKMIEESQKIFDQLNIDINPKTLVKNLTVGYQQIVEIAKALSKNAKILIMDEPTSTLTKTETETLFEMIDKLKSSGVTIIYISHRMDEIFKVCDRITVLRNGKNVSTKKISETSMEEVINNIVGGNMRHSFEWVERPMAEERKVLLEVKNLQSGKRVKDVSFSLHEGEILGIAGLMGSGRSETARAIFGIDPVEKGEIYIKGQNVSINSPRDAINAGLGLVPEDRRLQGLVLGHSVKDNTILPSLKKQSKGQFVQDKKANTVVENLVSKLNIKKDDIYKTVSLLSGGNQQKVVLAKWLINDTEILILDEPTSGVDIGAKSEIIEIIREFANLGKAVLIISSEMTELLAMSDRVIIMKEGTVINSIQRKNINNEEDVERAIQDVK